jgi:hypothetical protein
MRYFRFPLPRQFLKHTPNFPDFGPVVFSNSIALLTRSGDLASSDYVLLRLPYHP